MDATELDALIEGLSDDGSSDGGSKEHHTDIESIISKANDNIADPVNGLSICVEIDSALLEVSTELRHLYAPRLPRWDTEEISELVSVIGILGPDLSGRGKLAQAVGKNRAIEIETAIVDDEGCEVDWTQIQPLLDQLKSLISVRESLVTAAESCLEAPNLLEIVQPRTLVELLAWCGGVKELASTNPSNIPAVGRPRSRRGGFADGILGKDPLLISLPSELKQKGCKLVAAKIVLAARMDMANSSPNGSQGRKWRRNIEDRLDRLLAPPPSVRERPLAIPEESHSKRRGGRRIRRARERYAPSDAERQQRRIAFAESSGSGPIRQPAGITSNLRVSKAILERLKKSY